LRTIPVEGGPVTTLCDAPALRGASWGDDGTIVFSPGVSTGLMRIAATGGAPTELTKLAGAERTHRWPHVLPGSRAVLFTAHTFGIIYDDASIEAVVLSTGERKSIRRRGFAPQFAILPDGSGRLLFLRQGSLFAGSFDAGALEPRGDFAEVAPAIQSGPSSASYAVSSAGAMLYVQGHNSAGDLRIVWVDQSSRREPILDAPGSYGSPRVSPDGKRFAFSALTSQAYELRVKDLERDTVSRLSFMEGSNQWPVWTPDGKHIVFRSVNQPNPGLYWVRSDGGGVHRLTSGDEAPYSFSPDGRRLAFWGPGTNRSADLFTASIEGDPDKPNLGRPELFLGTPANEAMPAFSPDGQWIAYMSDDSGKNEIFVRSFSDPAARWQISNGGGVNPVWSRHGELCYLGPDQRIVAVPYTVLGGAFIKGKARRWSETAVAIVGAQGSWDLAPDGKRMAAVLPGNEDTAQSRLVLLMNFTDELQRRTAAK
jgi:serine/threonine-protein kinase